MDQKTTKIIFFGTPEFAVPSLEALIKKPSFNVRAVVTNPDELIGRGRKKKTTLPILFKKQNRGSSIFQSSSNLRKIGTPLVKVLAQKHKISVLQPEKLRNNPGLIEKFKKLNPDVCVVAAYGKLIPKEYLEIPRLGFINVHPSLLPKYRGPTPIQSAILNGEKETGIAILLVDEEIDHGPIISNVKYQVLSIKYYKEIENDLAELGANLLIETLPDYIAGKIKPKEQNHKQATFTKKFTRDDGRINWQKSAEDIFNQIRALNPEPGVWTIWNNKILKIHRAAADNKEKNKIKPGTVKIKNNDLLIKTGSGWLEAKKVQIEGKKIVSTQEFIRGYPEITSGYFS